MPMAVNKKDNCIVIKYRAKSKDEIMNSNILESLKTKYHSVIQKIIDENEPFYQFENQVHWNFFHDNNVALVAFCDKGFNIQINILAVVKAYEELNQPLMIELFILHEIRHLFQRFCVQDLYYNDPPKLAIPQAQQWANEFNNYIKATDNIELYYSQSIEFDAFSFSHAVMLYKYGNVEYIIPPKFLAERTTFIKVVQMWLKHFTDNKYPKKL